MRVVPIGTATVEHERTMRDLEELFSVPLDPSFRIVPMYSQNFPHMETKKRRGKDKQPRKKPEGSTPLQQAQRKRQSTLFIIEGAMSSILTGTSGLHPEFGNLRHLFLPEELEAIHEIRKAIHKYQRVRSETVNSWGQVKQNLAASVDQTEKKV